MAYTSEIEKLERRFAENPTGRNFAPLADAYRKAGELDRAIELCKGGLERHPDYISAHIVYGRCLIDKKDDLEAEQVFQKVLSLDPENIIALRVQAELADRGNRYDDAVQWLTRLLAVDPMNGDAAEALARAKGKAALVEKATEPMAAGSPELEAEAAEAASPPEPALEAEPEVRDSQMIDVDLAMAEAPTTALTKPQFGIEHAAVEAAPPEPPAPKQAEPAPGIEVFDGTVDFNAVAGAPAMADGIELQEEVELKVDAAPLEGLARTQYEGSGMFKVDAPEELPPEPSPPPPAPEAEGVAAAVDLPLIMPEDVAVPMARKTPAPPPERRRSTPPAAVALSDDDGAADTAALAQVEPVVTETMAELYLKQGHQEDALRVYEALLAQRPGDAHLQAKVDEVSGRAPVPARRAKPAGGQSAPEFIRRVLRGEPVTLPAALPPPPEPAADESEASTLENAFAAAPADPVAESGLGELPGAPTQPAADSVSLDAVFGDRVGRASTPDLPSTAAPGGGGMGGGGQTGGFSFDDFFSAPQPGGGKAAQPSQKPRSSGRTTRQPEDEADLDQFQAWLKGLKS